MYTFISILMTKPLKSKLRVGFCSGAISSDICFLTISSPANLMNCFISSLTSNGISYSNWIIFLNNILIKITNKQSHSITSVALLIDLLLREVQLKLKEGLIDGQLVGSILGLLLLDLADLLVSFKFLHHAPVVLNLLGLHELAIDHRATHHLPLDGFEGAHRIQHVIFGVE